MAIEWEIVEPANCVVLTWDEAFEANEFMSFYNDFSGDPLFRPGMNRLCDMRKIKFTPGIEELRRLAANIRKGEPEHGRRKVVLLAGSDATFASLRQFMAVAFELDADYHVTRGLDEAIKLMGLAPAYVLPGDR